MGAGSGSGRTHHPDRGSEPPPDFAQQVRDALRHLHDRTRLQTHPLGRYASGDAGKRSGGRGKALQDSLTAGIEAMRPANDATGGTAASRGYQLLVQRYVEGEEAAEVQAKLAIGKTEYYAEHQRALEAVTSWLWEQWRPATSEPIPAATNPVPLAAAFPPVARSPTQTLGQLPRHNLPVQLTSFIGRQGDIGEVKRLLSTQRLVTLTGTGGCGKTRLALRVAENIVEEFADGVWLFELAPLSDPALLLATIARTLDVQEEPQRPILATLLDYLRSRKLLLILDNCEHLIAAAAQTCQPILQASPNVRILATSREALGVGGEVAWRVPSLTLPGNYKGALDPAWLIALQTSEAIQLFLARARLADAGFDVTEQNACAIAQICTRLDGIPLAIEMAAARLKVLSVQQIAARLDDRFRLLTGGSRAALPRQQTLRAALDWSYNLLSEAERRLLRRISVFAAGCSLDAVEGVCSGDGVPEADVLDLLGQLVDRSLVVVDKSGDQPRYRLLETIRQYGHDRLVDADEAQATRDKHRDWFLALAERAEPELIGPRQVEWLDRLELEIDNLREALEWSVGQGAAEPALRFVGTLRMFWIVRDYWSEGQRWSERALTTPGEVATAHPRAKALETLGACAYFMVDFATMQQAYEKCVSVSREVGDVDLEARAVRQLGVYASERGDYASADSLYLRALNQARECGNRWVMAQALEGLALIAAGRRDWDTTLRLLAESLELFRMLGDWRAIATSLCYVGLAAAELGDYEATRAPLEEGLSIYQTLRFRAASVVAASYVGMLAQFAADLPRARSLLDKGLATAREIGVKWAMCSALSAQASLALAEADEAQAWRLVIEALVVIRDSDNRSSFAIPALGLRGALIIERGAYRRGTTILGAAASPHNGLSLVMNDRSAVKKALTLARTRLLAESYTSAYVEGQMMTLEQAIAYALEEDPNESSEAESLH
jgi:non-specific serine/threonine protein kinase